MRAYCFPTILCAGLNLVALTTSSFASDSNTLTQEERAEGWRLLFDGRSLNGWRASDSPGSFRIEEDAIVAEGPRSHLYYIGEMPERGFKDFEFSIEVQTSPGANSGVYFHTSFQETGWPAAGYEVQINNSDPPGTDSTTPASRSGSLWGIVDLAEAKVRDGEWFTLRIRVEGRRIVCTINGQELVDYMEPEGVVRSVRLAGKVLSSGTFALQAADPESRTRFRSIKVRPVRGKGMERTPESEGVSNLTFGRDAVSEKTFRMHWLRGADQGVIRNVTLRANGSIEGAPSENESRWGIDDGGNLVIYGRSGEVTSLFETHSFQDNRWILSGSSKVFEDIRFRLDEKLNLPVALDDESLNRIIRPWSRQRIVGLDAGESYRWETADGKERTIQLISVAETRDSVVNLVREADVRVAIDGEAMNLVCAPYVMPTTVGGLRIQADITSGMVSELPKQVSISLWEAGDPIVDTEAFRFPLSDYRLLSHSLQSYGEVVWLGVHDGDPRGVTGRHSYGIDLSGYENDVEVFAVADGVVHDVYPSTEDPYAALIRSANGVVWEYGHMQSLLPGIREGAAIRAGQTIGRLGKRGGSGNFSHLHLGLHPSPAHRTAVIRTQRLNFFPWIVAAYRAQHPQALFAIAGAHRVLRVGETCSFDASHSLSFGSEIVQYRWKFHDNEVQENARAEKTFRNPGVYVVELSVEDSEGRQDIDFCRVKVFPTGSATTGIPSIFLSHTPTLGIRAGQPVRFRGWVQAETDAPIRLDLGDGTILETYESYSEATHAFERPGLYVVTATSVIGGMPITEKQKVLVTTDGGLDAGVATTGTMLKPMAPGLNATKDSSVGSIVVGAGRSPDGKLMNPGDPLPERLDTISADIELINLGKGERVQVWIEKGENQTEPIDAVIEREGSGNLPFDLHVGDTPFPQGSYTLVVTVDERKRFTKDFVIGRPK